ncbi:MAG: porin family protein [bacterium]|nr:porin family protein [bacterium]
MKQLIIVLGLVLLLAAPTVLAQDEGPKLGVGAWAGMSIPVIQDDQESGMVFGFMGRFKVLPFLVLEPGFSFAKWGAPETIEGIDFGIDGSKLTSIGINATLGGAPGVPGVKPFFVAGIASYKVKNDDTGYDESNLGWNAGLGIGYGISPSFDLDFRGLVVVAPQENGSKKALSITGGLNFNFGASQ